jgi:fumarate reductase subunit D
MERQIAMVVLLLVIYLLPAGIAYDRNHRNRLAILITNVLTGVTVIGWIVAMIWACTANVEPKPKKFTAHA